MGKCIYCLTTKSDSEFNIEHVFPRAFGTYEPNTPTLARGTHPPVCKMCNSFFNENFEQVLYSHSFENFLRLSLEGGFGNKNYRAKDHLQRNIELWLSENYGLGRQKFNIVSPAKKDAPLVIEFPPQVRFWLDTGEDIFLTEKDLSQRNPTQIPGIDISKSEFYYPLGNKNSLLGIFDLLKGYGLTTKTQTELTPISYPNLGSIEIGANFQINREIDRAVAKICFNYLAYVTANIYFDFVYREEFNTIRKFIRYGEGDRGVVQFDPPDPSKLNPSLPETDGHLIVVEREPPDHENIVARVSFYNCVPYKVILGRKVLGDISDLCEGLHLDWKNRKVIQKGKDEHFRANAIVDI